MDGTTALKTEAQKSKSLPNLNVRPKKILPKMVSVILGHADVCSGANFSDQFVFS